MTSSIAQFAITKLTKQSAHILPFTIGTISFFCWNRYSGDIEATPNRFVLAQTLTVVDTPKSAPGCFFNTAPTVRYFFELGGIRFKNMGVHKLRLTIV